MQLRNVLRGMAAVPRQPWHATSGKDVDSETEGKNGPVYELPEAVELLNDVMPMVARDGIEPPTHGFSVRCSTS